MSTIIISNRDQIDKLRFNHLIGLGKKYNQFSGFLIHSITDEGFYISIGDWNGAQLTWEEYESINKGI